MDIKFQWLNLEFGIACIYICLLCATLVLLTFTAWASLVAQLVKKPSTMRETWVPSLGWEDPLEKGKAPHSNILAWRIPWTVTVHGVAQLDMTERLD